MNAPSHMLRGLAWVGIAGLALSARAAMTSASALLPTIRPALELTDSEMTVLTSAAPLLFAAVGIGMGLIVTVCRPEIVAAVALTIVALGLSIRPAVLVGAHFVVISLAVLAAMGVVNVVLPSLAARWFPGQIGPVTALYAALIAVSSALPPLVSAGMTQLGWRAALLPWAVVAALGAAPWFVLAKRAPALVGPTQRLTSVKDVGMLRGSTAVAVVFALSAGNAFALFSWLPIIAVDHGGMSLGTAAALLTVYSAMAIPVAVIVPWIVSRAPLIAVGFVGVTCIVAGDVGFALVDGPWLFVVAVVAGAGQLLYPLCLTVIATASPNADVTARLSALGQGLGYAGATVFPVLMSALAATVEDWSLTLLIAAAISSIGVAAILNLQSVFPAQSRRRRMAAAVEGNHSGHEVISSAAG